MMDLLRYIKQRRSRRPFKSKREFTDCEFEAVYSAEVFGGGVFGDVGWIRVRDLLDLAEFAAARKNPRFL